ncbi:hypothetical protein XBP1_1460004 [Xenorhabdus bovienii str. puntauvense]|nr:hypothetical protein XBP1_1460004 [Xenorhabdus bovienii str. puntauvense]
MALSAMVSENPDIPGYIIIANYSQSIKPSKNMGIIKTFDIFIYIKSRINLI